MTTDMSDHEALRAGEWAENELVTPRSHMVSGASVVGVWLLIPLALVGVSYVIASIVAVALLSPGPSGYVLLGITIVLQVFYWCLIAITAGRSWAMGLWALIPAISLIPTFGLARGAVASRLTSLDSSRRSHLSTRSERT